MCGLGRPISNMCRTATRGTRTVMSGAPPEAVSLPRGGHPTDSIGTGLRGPHEHILECGWQYVAETPGPALEGAVFQRGSQVQAIPGARERHVEQALRFFAF